MSAPDRARVLIVTALKEERDAILSRATDVRPGDGSFVTGRIGGKVVAIAATGDGVRNARRAAAELCRALRPAALIGAGVAGALTRELDVGDLLVSLRIRDSRGEVPPPDERLVSRALESGPAIGGMLLTVGRPVVAISEKARLAASVDSGGPTAIDMESAAWARVAAASGIPYVVIRSICDRADEELPGYIARSGGEGEGIRRAAVVAHALARPATVGALLSMRKRVSDCGQRLGAFLERLLASGA